MAVFKNKQNNYLTKSLFYEWCYDTGNYDYAIFTTKEEDIFVDGKRYQSILRLFLECDDPTGYKFANTHLGSWYHYEKLLASPWFKAIIDKALKELEIKMKSQALLSIVKQAKDPTSKSSFQASKFLLDQNWIEKDNPVGRPSKERILEEAQKMMNDKEEIEEDFARLISSSDSVN
jgi:hypothetical protein